MCIDALHKLWPGEKLTFPILTENRYIDVDITSVKDSIFKELYKLIPK